LVVPAEQTSASRLITSLSLDVHVRHLFGPHGIGVRGEVVAAYRLVLPGYCLVQVFEGLCAGGVAVCERREIPAIVATALLQLQLTTFLLVLRSCCEGKRVLVES